MAKDVSLTDVFNRIRSNPDIIGGKSLNALRYYISGYIQASIDNDIDITDIYLFHDLTLKTQRQHRIYFAKAWDDILNFVTFTPEKAWDAFWKIFDMCIEEHERDDA